MEYKYNLVSIWEYEKPMLKKVWFKKEFTPDRHIIVYDFEAMLEPLNEIPTDDLTYLWRDPLISVAIHDTSSKEALYIVDENPGSLIERFIEVLTEKYEEIVLEVFKQRLHPPDASDA